MTPEQNQLDVLINYKSNFTNATQELNTYLTNINSKIAQAEKELANLSSKKSKVSNDAYKAGKAQLELLYKERTALQETLKIRDNIATQSSAMLKMNKVGFDNEIKGRKEVLSQLKEDILARAKISSDTLNQWRANTDAQIKSDEARSKSFSKSLKDRLIEEQKYSLEQKKLQDRTWRGAWFGSDSGTTFGHKFLTTSQYAAAGTAIFGVASAVTALGSAALESELNMRTMAAVLDLSIPAAKELDKNVRALGEAYGGTTSEIEQVAISLGRAGVATKDITKATEVTLAMARLTGDTFDQSASAVISYQQVFGNTTSIEKLGNKLAYVANVSRLSTQDIGTLSNYALAAAKDVGLTEDAVGGLSAAFSNAGVNASTIGTQIRRFTTLLTDNSTAVKDFYLGIGVNQDNLLASLKQGGTASNKALLEFVKTLKTIDDAKFTKLTGNMDILAANSLQLMRNNSDNITKFVSDLQRGGADLLKASKVILDSYIVTYESGWNTLKNIASDGLQGIQDSLQMLAIGTNVVFGNFDKARLQSLAKVQQEDEKAFNIWKQRLDRQEVSIEEFSKVEAHFLEKRLAIEKEVNSLTNKPTTMSNDTRLKTVQALYDYNLKIADSEKASNNERKAAALLAKQYGAELKKLNKDLDNTTSKQSAVLSISGGDLDTQAQFIRSLVDAGKDTTLALSNFNNEYSKLTAKSKENIAGQVKDLEKLQYNVSELNTAINLPDISSQRSALLALSDKLIANNTELLKIEGSSTKANDDKLRVINTIIPLLDEQLKRESLAENLATKQKTKEEQRLKAEQTAQRTRDAAARREEAAAAKAQNIQEAKLEAEAKYAELTKQILEMDEDTTSKAEQKFRVQTQLVGLAYDNYLAAVGTNREAEKEKDYKVALAKYQEANYNFLLKERDLQVAKVNLLAQYKNSIDEITATEEYRLGLRLKERENDIEKLKMQVTQDYNEQKIGETEYNNLIQQINKLEELSKKKKDIYTYAIEKQRELEDQETIGYNTAKAGIQALENGMMDFFDITSEGWLDWHKLATNILGDIYKQLLQQLLIKQVVSGITGAIAGAFTSTPSSMAAPVSQSSDLTSLGISGSNTNVPNLFKDGGMIPTKNFAKGGLLSGGTGIKDDIYLGNVGGAQMFAMGGEFMTRKSSVNDETRGTLDYINKTGSVPNQGTNVNIPVSVNIENQTGNDISADMLQAITKQNEKGEYEKVISIVLKASQTDPRMRAMLKRS